MRVSRATSLNKNVLFHFQGPTEGVRAEGFVVSLNKASHRNHISGRSLFPTPSSKTEETFVMPKGTFDIARERHIQKSETVRLQSQASIGGAKEHCNANS